jgi:alkylhydroperoxidase family enzyme
LPDVQAAWSRWREYVLEGPSPISQATRHRLRLIAARNACDASMDPAAQLDSENADDPAPGSAETLSRFADKLSRTPWLVTSSDLEALRSMGMDDLAILHVIAVVAYQSAESRLRIGLAALARSED